MTRLVLLRHGDALGAAERCIGHTDIPLSPEGAAAMRRLAAGGLASLCATSNGGVRVVSSDLRRAIESAEIVSSALECDVECAARLRELDFGEWDGQSWREIERRDPERLRSWMERWTEVAAPGGESVGDLLARASSWARDVVTRDSRDQTIVVVSHAGWIRAAVSHILGYDIARMFEIPVAHARATVIDVGSERTIVVAWDVDRIQRRQA